MSGGKIGVFVVVVIVAFGFYVIQNAGTKKPKPKTER